MDGQMFPGMTIHNLLEKVDLLNFIFEEDGEGGSKKSDDVSNKTVIKTNDPSSAYLGKLNRNYNDLRLIINLSIQVPSCGTTQSRWMT